MAHRFGRDRLVIFRGQTSSDSLGRRRTLSEG